jgi:8-oxo-dGTP diphosphatase
VADYHLIDVHVLLIRDDEVLLTQRRDPNPDFDGHWHAPSGKLDAAESVLDAAVREAAEEVGVVIDPADLDHVHTIHVNGAGPEPRLGLFFAARHWIGEPTNREPGKCRAVCWFALDSLPERIIDYPATGITASGPPRSGRCLVPTWRSRPVRPAPCCLRRGRCGTGR